MSRKRDDLETLKTLPELYLGKKETAESAKVALSVNWANVLSKPSTFAPSAHSHDYIPLTGGTITGSIIRTGTGAGFVVANGTSRTMMYASVTQGEHIFGGSNNSSLEATDYVRVTPGSLKYVTGGVTYDVYHTGNKPSLGDIGAAASNHNHDANYLGKTAKAVSASSADAVAWGNVTGKPSSFTPSSHSHNEVITSNSGGFYEGNGDAANSTNSNVQIKSWYGIGFAPSISGQTVPQNQNAVWINVRNGNMGLRGQILAEGLIQSTSYMTTPTLVCDRVQGRNAANRFYTGPGTCRIDTNEGWIRIFTTAVGSSDSGLRIDPNGGVSLLNAGVGKHNFNSDGSKYGGSIEIEGTTYGMSPIDSPQFLIEDIIFDKEVQEEGTIIKLNNIFAKSINGKYAVFINNNKAEVIDKQYDNFKVVGYTGTIDIRIVGKRYDHENDYYKILGGFEHGVKEEIIK